MKRIILLLAVLLTLFASGCATQTTMKYQCQNGQVVDSLEFCSEQTCSECNCPEIDYSKCPQQKCPDLDCSECPKQIETKTITRYVCADGLVMDSEEDCKSSSSSQASAIIENSVIEGIIKDADSQSMVSLIKYENNLLTVEYKSSYSTLSIILDHHYEITKEVVSYVANLGLTPNFKIKVIDTYGESKRTSSLSWSEAQQLNNYEMSYDEWVNDLTSS